MILTAHIAGFPVEELLALIPAAGAALTALVGGRPGRQRDPGPARD